MTKKRVAATIAGPSIGFERWEAKEIVYILSTTNVYAHEMRPKKFHK